MRPVLGGTSSLIRQQLLRCGCLLLQLLELRLKLLDVAVGTFLHSGKLFFLIQFLQNAVDQSAGSMLAWTCA